jgi:formylmethanofuran dehydrogenase subunit E
MDIKRNMIEAKEDETSHEGETVCSECGAALKSFHEWIMAGNDRTLCMFCYKSYMFPNLDENYMEIFDQAQITP